MKEKGIGTVSLAACPKCVNPHKHWGSRTLKCKSLKGSIMNETQPKRGRGKSIKNQLLRTLQSTEGSTDSAVIAERMKILNRLDKEATATRYPELDYLGHSCILALTVSPKLCPRVWHVPHLDKHSHR